MARTKNTKRKQPSGPRYPQATYRMVDTCDLPDKIISNSHEIIQELLIELINRTINMSTNSIELSPESMTEENRTEKVVTGLTINNKECNIDEINLHDSNKENEVKELIQQSHEKNKDTNQMSRIHNILKEVQENRKIAEKEIEKPTIYSETVASTSRPTHIKGGKPLSFYESYYAKINSKKLRSMNRGKGIGKKKIKISSSHSQVSAKASSSGDKHFVTKLPTPKKHTGSGSKSYTSEGK